jgi:putative peptidoglycan lipid II flippase
MERIMRLFNKEFSKISEAAFVLGFFTLMSQILALFRDRLFAGSIGTGEVLDVYYAAFRIPDLMFVLGASLVSVSILMPFFNDKREQSQESGQIFLNHIFSSFSLFMIFISIILAIFLPRITASLYPGFSGETLEKTVLLSRIMMLSPILLGLSGLFSTITQTFKKFFIVALSPVFYNVGIIAGIVFLYPTLGIAGLAYGVVLGALLHMLIQLPVVIQQGFLPRFTWNINWADIRTVLGHSLPRTITLSMSKIVFLVFVSLASTLVAGTISVFNLSYNLQSVPLAIIGVSYSVAAFPILVDYYHQRKYQEFLSHVIGPIRQIIFWSLPVIVLFVVLRAQIVRVIFGTGSFDWSDTRLTAASLALFIVSIAAQSIVLLLVRAYYAAGRTWKPLWITLSSGIITIGLAFLFVDIYDSSAAIQHIVETALRIKGVPGSGVVMLSLAYSLGVFIQLVWLWLSFKRDFKHQPKSGINRSFVESLSASLIMGIVSYAMLQLTNKWFDMESLIGVFGHGFLAGIVGIVVAAIILVLIKNQEIYLVACAIKRKFWRNQKITHQSDL